MSHPPKATRTRGRGGAESYEDDEPTAAEMTALLEADFVSDVAVPVA